MKLDRLESEQSAERLQQREAHFAATPAVNLEMAKASLAQDGTAPVRTPANTHEFRRADVIKRQMAEWRQRNTGRDLRREM